MDTLKFGTGGLRGLMGEGQGRINITTIGAITGALASYILANRETGKSGVLIGYDSRHGSKRFAEEAAKVLAANGIPVYLCPEIRPVPFISFGCRHLSCQAAIMITASHNPASYNGYKVYWSDGGQVVHPHDTGIMEEMSKKKQVLRTETPLIHSVEIDDAYLASLSSLQTYPEKCGDLLKITYTSLHGTGITLAPQAFALWGFHNVNYVEEQIVPDGDFPTVSSPNPEEDSALKLGIEKMMRENSDLLLATDPDADRVGVMVRHEGQAIRLNGNQIICLCLEHLCSSGKLPPNPACVKTIVTSELFQAIADAHHIPCFNVLPGSKHIAALIRQWESNGPTFLFGGEESYGYMLGAYTRDKDGIASSLLIAEMALRAKLEGKTLIDKLNDLYAKYGNFAEEVYALKLPETAFVPPTKLLNTKVIAIDDYRQSLHTNLQTGKTENLPFPKSNVLTLWLEDGTKLTVRPSGTEPKIKFYCGVSSKTKPLAECQALARSYIEALLK